MSYRRDFENTEPPSESSDPNSGDDYVWATDDDYSRVFDVYPEETESHNKKRRVLLYPASSDQVAHSGEELRETPLPYREETLKTTDTLVDVKSKATMTPYDSHFSEPFDISKLFSSYAYESPKLDSSDGFAKCVIEPSECTKVDDIPQSPIALSDMVIEDSDVDEEYTGSLFRKIKNKRDTPTTNSKNEITALKNRVRFLENEVRILHTLINRFISGNDNTSK